MSRWNKKETKYSSAAEHYDLDYYKDQTRDGDLRGIVNAWKFKSLVKPGMDLLDFGCGDGALLRALGGSNGVEINPHSRATARELGCLVEENICAYNNSSMDLIISNHCIEHVENPLSVIKEMRRVIRDNGTIAIVVPCHRVNMPFSDRDRDYHLFSWSAANLGNLVKLAGFEVIEARELCHRWPPKWRFIYDRFGLGVFHAASRLWARFDRSSSQVICIAKPLL